MIWPIEENMVSPVTPRPNPKQVAPPWLKDVEPEDESQGLAGEID